MGKFDNSDNSYLKKITKISFLLIAVKVIICVTEHTFLREQNVRITFAGAERKDYLALWNCKLILKSPKISTRRPQTPAEGIWTLTYKSCTKN